MMSSGFSPLLSKRRLRLPSKRRLQITRNEVYSTHTVYDTVGSLAFFMGPLFIGSKVDASKATNSTNWRCKIALTICYFFLFFLPYFCRLSLAHGDYTVRTLTVKLMVMITSSCLSDISKRAFNFNFSC